MYHHINPLAAQLSDEICNILPVFHVLKGSDYTNSFYRRPKIQSFKIMSLKPELTTLIQSLNTPNPNFLEVTDFVLYVIYNRPSNEKTPGNSRYVMLFVKKKGKNKIFNDTKSLPPDQNSLNMKILRSSFVGYGMLSCMQPVYETLNPLTMVGN